MEPQRPEPFASGLELPTSELANRDLLTYRPPLKLRWRLALTLYAATFASTFLVVALGSGWGNAGFVDEALTWQRAQTALLAGMSDGLSYAFAVMAILTAHELGHYFQARRYGVPATLPYFIPMPLTPFGTMGAIIAMHARSAPTKALFDLAITGPLAGLVPALSLSALGLRWSRIETTASLEQGGMALGEPMIFKLLSYLTLGPIPEGHTVMLHPIAFAGWVGIFITALNLLPIGQLDGGHILYTLAPKRAHYVSQAFVAAAIVAVVVAGLWQWALLIVILLLLGLRHPPTADAGAVLDRKRRVLGWLTLLFVVVGFTPNPLIL